MLKKDLTVTGTRVQLRATLSDGLPKSIFGDSSMQNLPPLPCTHLLMTAQPGSVLDGGIRLFPGAILTVVDGPKKRDGINTVIVQDQAGQQGHVYWCALRASADHLP